MNYPKVAILSLFRDNGGLYITKYKKKVTGLNWPGDKLRFYTVEGDSVDDTFGDLALWAEMDQRVRPVKQDTGIKYFGSVIHPQRFLCLAQTANAGLHRIRMDGWADYVLLLESDLDFDPDLIRQLMRHKKPCIAPMIWKQLGHDHKFYDIWAFRHLGSGQGWPQLSQEWYHLNFPAEVVEARSVGSCVLIEAWYVYHGAKYSPQAAILGMSEGVRELGGSVWVDPLTHIYHA